MANTKKIGFSLVISAFILLGLTGIRTISNPELFTRIALGQAGGVKTDPLSYAMSGKPWINTTPLYNELVYGLWKAGGAPLVTLAHTAAVMAAFILLFRFGKSWGGRISQALTLLLCAKLMLPVFNPGPAAFGMLFTAIFLTLLYRTRNFNLLAALLIVLQILWTSIHPSFILGPLTILLFAFENWQETRNTSRNAMVTPLTTRLLALTGATLAATLINPNMVNLHRHLLTHAALLTGTENLEWVSLFSNFFPQNAISSLTVLTLIIGAGGLITLQKRLPPVFTALALLGAFLTVRSVGALQWFAFLAFPFLILSFSSIGEYLSRTLKTLLKTAETLPGRIMLALTFLLIISSTAALLTNRAYGDLGSASRFGLGVEKSAFPTAAAGIFNRADFPKTILNIAHDGGYIALNAPGRKIFCDDRTDFYGLEFYRTINRALLGQQGAWKTIMTDWNPHAVVLNACWPDTGALAARLLAAQVWKLAYFDGTTLILVRDLPEYASLINDPSIQKQGLEILEQERRTFIRQSKGFVKAGNPSRLIGAAGVYLAFNRQREAESLYSLLVRHCPKMAGARVGLGQSLILSKQISSGIAQMEKAARLTPRNGRVWMSLYQAYQLKGDEAKARYAAEKLNKFYKAEKATIEQQAIAEKKKAAKKPVEQPTNAPAFKTGLELELPTQLK